MLAKHRITGVIAAGLALLVLDGCASSSALKPDPRDPWERVNRATYHFNDTFDRAVARPVARTYTRITPQPVQTGVRNFFDNIEYPTVIVNDLLQGELKPFVKDTGRLLMNTTLGLGGLLDPATRAGLEKNERDFGQTFGKWGVKSGPYVVLPFLGPSDVRDGLGLIPAIYTNGLHYIQNNWAFYSLYLLDKVDVRARLQGTDQLLDSAYDPYAFLRNAYLQRRGFLVGGSGAASPEEQQEEELLKEAGETDQDAAAPKEPPVPPK